MKPWYAKLVTENAWGIAAKLAMFTGGIGSAVIFPLLLGPEDFGTYSVVFSLANIWVFFASFSLDTTAVKFVSASLVRKNTAAYLGFFAKWQLFLSTTASLALYLCSDLVAYCILGDEALAKGIRASALYVFFYSIFTLTSNVFVGLQRNRTVLYSYLVYHLLRIGIPAVLVFVYHDYTVIIGGTALAALAAVLFLVTWLRNTRYEHGAASLDYGGIKRYTFYGSLGYLGVLLFQWVSSLVVGVFDTVSAAGFYRIGFMWVSAIGLLIPVSSRVLFSFYAEKTERHEKDKVQSIFQHSLKYSLIFSLLAIIELVLASDHFIAFIYGTAFLPAASTLVLLSFLAVEIAVNPVNLALLQGVGRIDVTTVYNLCVSLVALIANLLVVGVWGMEGVAASNSIIRVAAMVLLTVYVTRHLRLQLPVRIYGAPIAIAFATIIIISPLKPAAPSPLGAISYALLIAVSYGLLLIITKTIDLSDVRRIIFSSR